jgi:hypothetical protein
MRQVLNRWCAQQGVNMLLGQDAGRNGAGYTACKGCIRCTHAGVYVVIASVLKGCASLGRCFLL